MNCFCYETYANKPKRCLHCKFFVLIGVSGGSCCKSNEKDDYKSSNDHCKYFKRDNEIFDKNGKVKNQELYDEMFL